MIRAAWHAVRRAALRYEIWELEHHLADCEAHGITQGMMMSEWRGHLCALRVQLSLLTPPRCASALQHSTAPQAAEACTDIGADYAPSSWARRAVVTPGFAHAAGALALIAAAALLATT